MKKKILSSLLFAALVGGAVSTFTACKDYDDDINSLQKKVDQLETLKAVKADVDAEIASLKTQLETAKSAIDSKAEASTVAALETRIKTLEDAKTSLENRIKTLEDAGYAKEQWVIDNYATIDYVDGLYANLIAVDGENSKLAEPLKKLLENEFDALKAGVFVNLQNQLDAISKLEAVQGQDPSPIVQAIKDLQAKVGNFDASELGSLAKQMNELSIKVNNFDAKINLLTVLCGQQLRGLVFQPQAYYWGVEATRLFTLDGVKWDTQATAWDKFETSTQKFGAPVDYGYTKYNRYPKHDFFKVLDFVATYHMNPSTAKLDETNEVSVVSDDKEFLTRSAEAGLSVKDWKTEAGDLIVNLTVANKNLIKQVNDHDGQLTVFATQVKMKGEEQDTVITSDYATIVKRNIKDVKIFHKVADATKAANQYGTFTSAVTEHPVTGAPIPAGKGLVNHTAANNAIACPNAGAAADLPTWSEEIQEGAVKTRAYTALTPSTTLGPVLGTVKQSVDYFAQDWVKYDCAALDLTELVCTRVYDGTLPIEVNPSDLGLHYVFELTALHILNGTMVGDEGDANTSESAHAAIQGNTFRPQMVTTDGKQAAYGSVQGKQTIGRTPVVRVSLVDEDGIVYDYGYIRLLIVDKDAVEPSTDDLVKEYVGKDWSYGHECDAPAWNWSINWATVEHDLYTLSDMSRDEFVETYLNETLGTDGPELIEGSRTAFKQYVRKNGKFVELTTPIGTVFQESGISSTGEETSTLKWNVTGKEAVTNFTADNTPEIAVKYKSRNSKYPNIYVVIKPGKVTIYDEPVAEISWDALKNPSYWYANNSNVSATTGGTAIENATEMHNNVLTPEDNASATGSLSKNFRQTVSSTMLNNEITGAKLFVKWTTAPAQQAETTYAVSTFKNDLVFSAKNNGKKYTGESGTVYTMTVSVDGKTLSAYITSPLDAQPVAQIIGANANAQKIVYGGNTKAGEAKDILNPFDYQAYGSWAYAKDLLNYKAHNALDDNTVRAIVGVNITAGTCNRPVKHNDATFDVRFLRPINVANAAKGIEDANTEKLQIVKIIDLVKFTDWREAWKDNYVAYYGIKSVSIDKLAADGDRLSENEKVLTNQSGKEEALKVVNSAIDFIYTAPGTNELAGTLTYKNFSSTVDEFYVKIPLTVEYFWGKINTTATVTVKRTAHNAPGK